MQEIRRVQNEFRKSRKSVTRGMQDAGNSRVGLLEIGVAGGAVGLGIVIQVCGRKAQDARTRNTGIHTDT